MITNEKTDDVFYVNISDSGERLDVFLAKTLQGISRAQIQKQIADGAVLLNGKTGSKKSIINTGDRIDVRFNPLYDNRVRHLQPQDIPLDILYEDEYFVAVNKPPAMVVHPGSGVHEGTLVNALLARISSLSDGSASDRPGIVHRLDKDTSGVLIVAKTNSAHTAMASVFANRTIEKIYNGFCFGMPAEQHGKIDLPLDRSHTDPIKRSVSKNGKAALTEYWILHNQFGISAVRFKLHTGRTHQIRVHCSVKGFPIIGDSLYGGGQERLMRVAPLERPFASRISKCFSRQALHARSLSFIHPFSGAPLHIEAPLPIDFKDALLHFRNPDVFDS
ncbi:MAG: RluA family pseudouridine synthase [Fibrobacter sp.]|nr:RluA family pseudouridine synthase [Fibrobacter sp.]